LEKHTAHVKELKELVKQQNEDSPAKAELDNVLKNAEKHVTDLESHIKKGEKLVDDKEKQITKIEKKLNITNQVDKAQAKVLKVDKKL
jgi:septal ring factor EnvC (AmiA/AmiB activator)